MRNTTLSEDFRRDIYDESLRHQCNRCKLKFPVTKAEDLQVLKENHGTLCEERLWPARDEEWAKLNLMSNEQHARWSEPPMVGLIQCSSTRFQSDPTPAQLEQREESNNVAWLEDTEGPASFAVSYNSGTAEALCADHVPAYVREPAAAFDCSANGAGDYELGALAMLYDPDLQDL
ncbi:hypothetical protein AK830_g12281 [Neonectria ditissima]|uniref:Uncharacterized protein n=1 Tax=Neonectria ditissima TaxID=78410 RepID=A0A0P7AB60_9HYPO|nr:hypothetical protein AK830_g12281 [Neonectria ditissima]